MYLELVGGGDFNRRDAKCLAQLQQTEASADPTPYTLTALENYMESIP